MQRGVSRDPAPLLANLSPSSITVRYRLKYQKSSHIYSSSSDDSSPSPPPPTWPKKRQLQLSKKQKVIHYRGLGLPAGTAPLSLYSQLHNTSNPDHRPSSSHQQPPWPSSSNTIQSSSSGLSQVPDDSIMNQGLGEGISLAPASPISSLSSTTSSNHSQSIQKVIWYNQREQICHLCLHLLPVVS